MKTRIILFLGLSAIVTLSFTFVSITTSNDHTVQNTGKNTTVEPAGGLLSEEKL